MAGPHRYVVIEGVIGVGKTTLVERLARALSARKVFEEFETNPFLASFYKDKESFAFSTQVFFLMSRFRQQETLAQGELFSITTLSDYLFDKDRIFALLTLRADELSLYERLFSVLKVQVPRPDLIIYLKADLEVVLSRIAARGRSYEADMDPEYIRALGEAYSAYFAEYEACPVITVDTSKVDLRDDERALARLVELIQTGGTNAPELSPAGDTLFLPGID
ncbi:MAG: deoxynucleoside kinase [Myxococcota bacterium]